MSIFTIRFWRNILKAQTNADLVFDYENDSPTVVSIWGHFRRETLLNNREWILMEDANGFKFQATHIPTNATIGVTYGQSEMFHISWGDHVAVLDTIEDDAAAKVQGFIDIIEMMINPNTQANPALTSNFMQMHNITKRVKLEGFLF